MGDIIHYSRKVSMQVQQALKKANSTNGMLAFLARGFKYMTRDVLLQLYRTLVRPHLEYCGQFDSPNLKQELLAPEGIQ